VLKELCEIYGIKISENQILKLEEFIRHLVKAPFNLTAVKEFRSALIKHVVEVLLPLKDMSIRGKIVDVGSGGGVPAIPVAVWCGEIAHVWALESVRKKAQFVREVVRSLGLKVDILHDRAEELGRSDLREKFDIAFSRALGPLPVALELMAPLVRVEGKLYIYSGRSVEEELAKIQRALNELGLELQKTLPYIVEGKELRLLVLTKRRSTPERYPRRFGTIKKKPLVDYGSGSSSGT